MKFKWCWVASVLTLAGCLEVDDQRLATKEQMAKINPAPVARDFRAHNQRHLVLVAVLDSGVDYNHPDLQANIHFNLDKRGRPTGAGWDYLGDDAWPAPYLARTNDVNPSADPDEQKRSATTRNILANLARVQPDLAAYFDPDRAVETEQWIGHHGTHVAGLITQGDARIGVLPYRVALLNLDPGLKLTGVDRQIVLFARIAEHIRQALESAIADGARVINMSLALAVGDSKAERAAFEQWSAMLRSIMKAHPEVLFLASAGNDGHPVPAGTQLPCGIAAANLVCVTSIDGRGRDSSFSNRPAPSLSQLKAIGEDVQSDYPSAMCANEIIRGFSAAFVFPQPDQVLKTWGPKLSQECALQHMQSRESGTSMSAPVAAHEAALILMENSSWDGEAVIAELQKRFPEGIKNLRR